MSSKTLFLSPEPDQAERAFEARVRQVTQGSPWGVARVPSTAVWRVFRPLFRRLQSALWQWHGRGWRSSESRQSDRPDPLFRLPTGKDQ